MKASLVLKTRKTPGALSKARDPPGHGELDPLGFPLSIERPCPFTGNQRVVPKTVGLNRLQFPCPGVILTTGARETTQPRTPNPQHFQYTLLKSFFV